MEALASTENTAPTRKQKRAFASPSQNKRSKYSTEEVEFRHCGLEGLRRPLLSANADTTTQMNENYRPSHALSSEGIGISSNPHTLIASLRRRTSLQRNTPVAENTLRSAEVRSRRTSIVLAHAGSAQKENMNSSRSPSSSNSFKCKTVLDFSSEINPTGKSEKRTIEEMKAKILVLEQGQAEKLVLLQKTLLKSEEKSASLTATVASLEAKESSLTKLILSLDCEVADLRHKCEGLEHTAVEMQEKVAQIELLKSMHLSKQRLQHEEELSEIRAHNEKLENENSFLKCRYFHSLALSYKLADSMLDKVSCNTIDVADLFEKAERDGISVEGYPRYLCQQLRDKN